MRNWILVCGVTVALLLYGYSAYRHHTTGSGWGSALGFPVDRFFFNLLGGFVVPVLVTVVAMGVVNTLPPSRQKTVLSWIGWLFFVFLFLWWSPLRVAVSGTH